MQKELMLTSSATNLFENSAASFKISNLAQHA